MLCIVLVFVLFSGNRQRKIPVPFKPFFANLTIGSGAAAAIVWKTQTGDR